MGTRLVVLAALALSFSLPARAQTLYGSLVGTVTDESGLAVPGATVKITQAETNQTRDTTTNGTATAPGDYTATSGTLSFAPGVLSHAVAVPEHNYFEF